MALRLLAVLAAFGAAYFARAILIPAVVAVFLAILIEPAAARMQRRGFGRGIIAAIVVPGLIAAMLGVGWACYAALSNIVADIPSYSYQIRSALAKAQRAIQEKTEKLAPRLSPSDVEVQKVQVVEGVRDWGRLLLGWLGSLFEAVGIAVFVPFLVLFMITEKATLKAGFDRLVRPFLRTEWLDAEIPPIVRAYFLGTLVMGLGVAFFQWLVFAWFGLKGAGALGLVTGFLNLIPIVGLPLALALPVGQAMIQFGRLTPTFIAAVCSCLGLLHLVTGNYFVPRFIGAKLKINGAAATAGLLFWGWLWGAAGFLLALPLTAVAKVLLESNEKTRALSRLLAAAPPAPSAYFRRHRLLKRAASADDAREDHHDGDDRQDVDEAGHGVRAHQPKQPKKN